ncbi:MULTISPECIES: tetratricopeptide repeat protein [Pseudomonadati]|uniref:Sel1 repeat family protein n=1 Tax=Shewanella aestuarii TaxID=1028752 RepID=A0ABT0KWV6_9GAMM|nr:tetratricopeptide repeat protein [Shewanella aestuarii]MCL1115946.1 sel1 repeat family protein [Shewanella aestuarii]GGN69633.1 hypothetical protein GCM10009193_03790 [Shewanella aestuarii]
MKINTIIFSLLVSFFTFTPTQSEASQLSECNTSDCVEYFKAYRILTKRGHSSAMAMLGELYYSGYGTDKDLDMALKWYRRAGKYGVLDAKYKAGVMYLQDTHLKDIDEGIDYLIYASKLGHSQSSLLLGKLYLGGGIVEQNVKLADEYLSLAYEERNQAAIQYAETLYYHETTKSLPLDSLYAHVAQDIAQLEPQRVEDEQTKVAVNFPEGEMETIDVINDSFEDMFRSHIAQLNNMIPDTAKGTGSNIAGQTCGRMWGCSSEGDRERIQDMMLSDWGLRTLQFRLE